MPTPIRIVYFGTEDFAVPPLRSLLDDRARFAVKAVVTRPPLPAGRGLKTRRESPVQQLAEEREVPVLTPERDDFRELQGMRTLLRSLEADIFVVAAYGMMIPGELLEIPRHGSVNLHGSILPKYRGASPIETSLLEGERTTGVSLMRMDEKMDHGPVYGYAEVSVSADDDYPALSAKLADAAASLLVASLGPIVRGRMKPVPQDHAEATFTKMIRRDDGAVDWRSVGTARAERMIRAFTPWPGVFTFWRQRNGKTLRIKILRASPADDAKVAAPGTAALSSSGALIARTADGWLVLEEVQPEGRRPMSGTDFVRGYPAVVGARFSPPERS